MPGLSDGEEEAAPAARPPAAAARGSAASVPVDVWAGLAVMLGLSLRIPLLRGNVPALRVHAGSIAAAALCPAHFFFRRPWYQRRRARLVLLTRLLIGACLVLPYDMPSELRSTSGPSLVTTFALYTSTLPLLFLSVGEPACLAVARAARRWPPPPHCTSKEDVRPLVLLAGRAPARCSGLRAHRPTSPALLPLAPPPPPCRLPGALPHTPGPGAPAAGGGPAKGAAALLSRARRLPGPLPARLVQRADRGPGLGERLGLMHV